MEKEKDEFIKFPHTPHIKWLSNKPIRDDKIMSSQEVSFLLSGKVDIEEKIDGTNIGISFNNNAEIRVQRRGSYISDLHKGEFIELASWLDQRINIIFDNLSVRYVLFGEWCKLKHSVYYDKLPDYFIGFDLFDKEKCYFLSPLKRGKMLERMDIVKPYRFFRGSCSLSYVEELRKNSFSHYRSKGKPEGLYIRRWSNEKILARGKIVDPDFIDNIKTHWRSKETVANRVVS